MGKRTISLCMIVRDEESNLSESLRELASVVDEIIVVDTGSTDHSRQVAAGLGARVFDFPWIDNFSAARNESCRHARGDYIFWMDADDRLDRSNLPRLSKLIGDLPSVDSSRVPIFLMQCVSMTSKNKREKVSHARIFPNIPEIKWVRRIHERLDCSDRAHQVCHVHTDIVIDHLGYRDSVQFAQKRFRNSRLLEQEFVLHPDNVLTLFYLGREYHWRGDMPSALKFFRRSIELDRHKSEMTTPLAYLFGADALRRLGRGDKGIAMLDEGLSQFKDFAPLVFRKGCVLREARRFSEAEPVYRKLLSLTPHQVQLGWTWFDLEQERWRLMLGHVLHELGRHDEAQEQYQQALREYPDFPEALFALGQFDIHMGRADEVEPVARRLALCPGGELELSLLRAQVCILKRKFDEARHWISRALAVSPENVGAHALRSHLLFQEGLDWQQCREAHEMLLKLDPRNIEGRRRLEQIRAILDRRNKSEFVADDNRSGAIPPVFARGNIGAANGLVFSC